MGTRSIDGWLTRDRAGYAVLALVVGAAVLGHFERRIVPADSIPLSALPMEIGQWTVVEEQVETQPDGSYKMLRRIYQNEDGHRAHLTVQATYTRAGSLRDWSLAMMADGWAPTDERLWRNEDGSFVARLQRLEDGRETRAAVTWYTSAHSHSASFKRAQLMNWHDRLLGRMHPWAGLYVIKTLRPGEEDEQALTLLADAAGAHLRSLLAEDRAQATAWRGGSAVASSVAAAADHSPFPTEGEIPATAHHREGVSH